MNSLLKYKKDELLTMCKDCNKKVNSSNTKAELSRILLEHVKSGGRLFKCQKGSKVRMVESRTNPQRKFGSKTNNNEICTETSLTKNSRKSGCSLGLKTGKECKPCVVNKKGRFPKECKGCVSGNNVFYCK